VTIRRFAAAALAAAACLAAAAPSPADRLRDLFDREWQARLREDPLFATAVGAHEYDDRLPAMSLDDLKRRDALWRGFLAELASIPAGDLGPADRINASIFGEQLRDRIASFRFGAYQIPMNADSGFHTDFARLPQEVPLRSVRDYENYVARLRAFPRYVAEQIALMRLGLARGMTLPRVVLEGFETTMSAHLVGDPADSLFYPPFESFPPGVPEEERPRLRAAGRAAIAEGVVPGYRSLLQFMTGEYMPGARASLGASELPDGPAYYADRIRHFTTLDLTAAEIHATGLGEVERIRREMEAIIAQVGFQGSFAEFLAFLRTDPRFYARSAGELLKEAAWIAKRMDGRLPELFGRIPRLPYTVEAVPDHLAPKYTTGRYVQAPIGSTRPGIYWVNTYDLPNRPLYELEALTLHEAVPGHHFQIALNQELEDLPNFRRHSYLSAFGEGWGLYSEFLGLEAGFYTDPYSNFGRLTYEMWRACRLVVDTGVHAMGWSRERMLDFLASNTALSLLNVRTETDRYISWPGQALAYKIGQLKILELRRRAEQALGGRFDVRAFHDAVLENGSIPLDVLERRIDDFIEVALRRGNGPPPAGDGGAAAARPERAVTTTGPAVHPKPDNAGGSR
jgi:uncharacterized protein (DUF885 family)